jgi:hypothetical protein
MYYRPSITHTANEPPVKRCGSFVATVKHCDCIRDVIPVNTRSGNNKSFLLRFRRTRTLHQGTSEEARSIGLRLTKIEKQARSVPGDIVIYMGHVGHMACITECGHIEKHRAHNLHALT